MGCTIECFQDAGKSQVVRQVLMIWRRTWPMASKESFKILIQIPSEPQAPEFFIKKRIVRRKSRETGSRVKAQAPTLGRRQGKLRRLPPVPDLTRDTRPHPDKVLVKFVWVGLRRSSLCRLFALDNLADVSKNRGRTLLGYPPGNILPYIE